MSDFHIRSPLPMSTAPAGTEFDFNILKAIVYALLIINLGVYFWQDWQSAGKAPQPGISLVEWADQYATTLDDLAWLVLLLLYELESAWLSEESFRGALKWIMQAASVVCYAAITTTLCMYILDVHRIEQAQPLNSHSSVCQLADQDLYYLYNQDYTNINARNCASLGAGGRLFRLNDDTVTDANGLMTARIQAWLSVIESAAWLVIVLVIALLLQLQAREIAGGKIVRASNIVTSCCFTLIFAFACYWAWMGHYIYLWDDLLWIGGFVAIEINLTKWRREIRGGEA